VFCPNLAETEGWKIMKHLSLLAIQILILSNICFVKAETNNHYQVTHKIPNSLKNPNEVESNEIKFVPGRLIIKCKDQSMAKDLEKLNKKFKITSSKKFFKSPLKIKESEVLNEKKNSKKYLRYTLQNIFILEVSPTTDIYQMASEYSKCPAIEYAEPDYIPELCDLPNDTYVDPDQDGIWSTGAWGQEYEDLWGLKKINADTAWDIAYSQPGAEVIVAVIDTGLDCDHEDISANVWINSAELTGETGIDDDGNGYIDDIRGWNFYEDSNNVEDRNGHGTHVAGIIGAVGNNATGICGVAWNSKLMGLPYGSSSVYTAEAICYAADNGAKILNLSWRFTTHPYVIEDAIKYAYYGANLSNTKCAIIAAAGNDSDDTSKYFPQCMKEVIVVGSSDQDDLRYSSSNYGYKIDVMAPGVSILSLLASGTTKGTPINDKYTLLTGTSMAAPMAAGVSALIASIYPDYDNEQIRQLLRIKSDDIGDIGWDTETGYGRVNAAEVLDPNVIPCKSLILSPKPGAVIDALVDINGISEGINFSHYALFYKELTDESWVQIGEDHYSPVSMDILGSWDVNSITDGQYFLRLVTTDSNEIEFEDRSLVYIDRTYITYPENGDILRLGDTITIEGTVEWPDFQNYYIEYQNAKDPNAWYTEGIYLTDNGSNEIVNGCLAEFRTSEIIVPESGFYNIRIIANGEVGANIKLYLDPTLKQGWPKVLPEGYQAYFMVQAGASDLDRDGRNEIVVNCQHAFFPDQLWALTSDANTLPGWPVNIENCIYYGCPAIGDLEHDGLKEVACAVSLSNDEVYLYVFKSNGDVKNGWPVKLYGDTLLPNTVLLSDINSDDFLEVIAISKSYDPNVSKYIYTLEVFDYQGAPFPGQWPYHISSSRAQTCYYNRLMAVGNMDDDQDLEIIYPNALYEANETIRTKTELYVIDPNGTVLPNWPIILDYDSPISSPAIGDINRDGFSEIVLAADNRLYALNRNGQVLWDTFTYYSGSPALGDLTGDGYLEVIVNRPIMRDTCIWNYQGETVKKLSHNGLFDNYNPSKSGSIVIGDINSDGAPDIVISCNEKVVAWDINGEVIPGFPKQIGHSELMTPLITDLENDGSTDLIAISNDYEDKERVTIYAWELNSIYNKDNLEWPQYHGNSQRTGYYDDKLVYGDFDEDFDVDTADLMKIAEYWLDFDLYTDIAPVPYGDGIVNMKDFGLLAEHWLE
jgi:hypothetical protein